MPVSPDLDRRGLRLVPARPDDRSGAMPRRLWRGARELAAAPGAAVLVLRVFLGATFAYAGLEQLADGRFFDAGAPGSLAEQLRAAVVTSPLHHLLDPALHATFAVALVISLGELAVGLGTLLGLLARPAAAGGMLLSLAFFLTVSFDDRPFYLASSLVFLFAWTPLALAGPGPLSLDARHRAQVAEARAAMELGGARSSVLLQHRAAQFGRRALLARVATVALVGAAGAALAGIVAEIGHR